MHRGPQPGGEDSYSDGCETGCDPAAPSALLNTGEPGDPALSPEDGVNILGLVSDTGDQVDSSDDAKWNDADPAQLRAFVCCTGSCSAPAPAPAPPPVTNTVSDKRP